jgi:hypothetical protein
MEITKMRWGVEFGLNRWKGAAGRLGPEVTIQNRFLEQGMRFKSLRRGEFSKKLL